MSNGEQKVEIVLYQWVYGLFVVGLIVAFSFLQLRTLDRIADSLEAPKTVQPGIDSNDTDAFLTGLGLREEPDE